MHNVIQNAAALRIASRWHDRARGLLGTKPSGETLLLAPCHSVHTFGMGYPLDVAFIGSSGAVVCAYRCVPPGRVLSCQKAVAVLERAYTPVLGWYRLGDSVEIGRKVGVA